MPRSRCLIVAACLSVCAWPLTAAAGEQPDELETPRLSLFSLDRAPGPWLAAAAHGDAPATAPAPPAKGPPLPLHTIEGVGGLAITPMAYLVNPGPKGTTVGLPSFSFTYVGAGAKNIQSFAFTQTFFRRLELGYCFSRHGLGGLNGALEKATGIDVHRDEVYLHNFNVRAMLLEENAWDLPVPALTAGVHFKYNHGIRQIDDRLAGALGGLGFARSNGMDFTLTASKTFPNLVCGRPVIASVGMRLSQAAHIGYLGFSQHWDVTVEGNVACLVTDWLALAYEFRQKANPYHDLGNIITKEDSWHMWAAGIILSPDCTLALGLAHLGDIHNTDSTLGFAVQLKYEF